MSAYSKLCHRSFSLRTLFLLMTATGIWLGWNLHLARCRREALRELDAQTGVCLIQGLDDELISKMRREPPRGVSLALRLFGEQPVQMILFYDDLPDDAARIRRLFPEAVLRRVSHANLCEL